MRITVDTQHDSHEDIKKVIKMLQHLISDAQEVFTNEPSEETQTSPIANIFGDTASVSAENSAAPETSQTAQETKQEESTEDLFAELFSEEELKKMDIPKEDEVKPKDKKYNVELY